MRLHLKVIEGPRVGQKVSLSSKKSFGRNTADVDLADPKASGIHGFFEYIEGQGWFIVDNKSRNGIWVNDIREQKALLRDGDILRVGDTRLMVCLFESGKVKIGDQLIQWFQALADKLSSAPSPLTEIKPEIQLRFARGVQYGESLPIFYGPRKAGKDSLDICLYDELAPVDAFEIRVKGKYAYFFTNQKEKVKLNDQSVMEKQLKPGDLISFGDTQIIVDVDEGHGFGS